MGFGVGQHVVQLVRDDARHSAAESLLPPGGRHRDEIALYKETDAVAIHIDEGKDFAVADVSPAERTGVPCVRPEGGDIALPSKVDYRQLRRDPAPRVG